MGLDIYFKETRPVLCPHCGQMVMTEEVSNEWVNGREWYPFLESIGYYVPYEQRTEENDWYGKDMTLTEKQVEELYAIIKKRDMHYGAEVRSMIMRALLDGTNIVVNAVW